MTVLHALREQGKTVIAVHHDLATVRDYFDQVTLLNQRIVACGPVAKTFTKDNIRTTFEVTAADDTFLSGLT